MSLFYSRQRPQLTPEREQELQELIEKSGKEAEEKRIERVGKIFHALMQENLPTDYLAARLAVFIDAYQESRERTSEWRKRAKKLANEAEASFYTKAVIRAFSGEHRRFRRFAAEQLIDQMKQEAASDDSGIVRSLLIGVEKQKEFAVRSAAKLAAKKGATAKLKNDPKQKDKEKIKELWQQYQAGRATFKSGADFARHAVETFPSITSVKSVERWVTEWRKEQKNNY